MKVTNSWYHNNHIMLKGKEVRHRNVHTVWVHLMKVLEKIMRRTVVAWGWSWGGKLTGNYHRRTSFGDRNVLYLDSGSDWVGVYICQNSPKIYTSIELYIIDTLIKMIKNWCHERDEGSGTF